MSQIQANGITLNYRWDGPEGGPVIMLSHSLGADLTMWEPQVAPLTAAGFRLLRYDHRGHGGSAAPDGAYTIEQLAADAVGLLDALGLTRVHFCGLSMGGMVGQVLGARHGHRLLSLASVLLPATCRRRRSGTSAYNWSGPRAWPPWLTPPSTAGSPNPASSACPKQSGRSRHLPENAGRRLPGLLRRHP